jgi:hypothetical protein
LEMVARRPVGSRLSPYRSAPKGLIPVRVLTQGKPRVNPGLCFFGHFGPRIGNVRTADPKDEEPGEPQQTHLVLAPELYTQLPVGVRCPISPAPAFTHGRHYRCLLGAPLNGANGTQAGSLCYINAVASSLQVHSDPSWDRLPACVLFARFSRAF